MHEMQPKLHHLETTRSQLGTNDISYPNTTIIGRTTFPTLPRRIKCLQHTGITIHTTKCL